MAPRGRPRLYATHAEKIQAYRQRKRAGLVWPPLPPGPYDVLYAAPDWPRPRPHAARWRHAMPPRLAQLCRLPVLSRATPQAVLWLWVPVRRLADSLEVVRAWGFTYHTLLIWDKGHPGVVYLHDAEPELLLYCSRRTGPLPAPVEARVAQLPRAGPAHPDAFRAEIERRSPSARRLALFPRAPMPGWEVWPCR